MFHFQRPWRHTCPPGRSPGRRILFHINNTNPVLLSDLAERRQVEAAGFEVAFDGMEVTL